MGAHRLPTLGIQPEGDSCSSLGLISSLPVRTAARGDMSIENTKAERKMKAVILIGFQRPVRAGESAGWQGRGRRELLVKDARGGLSFLSVFFTFNISLHLGRARRNFILNFCFNLIPPLFHVSFDFFLHLPTQDSTFLPFTVEVRLVRS